MLTEKYLKTMGLTPEQTDAVWEAHTGELEALREQLSGELSREQSRAQSQTDAAAQLQRELDDARQELQLIQSDGWKARYEALSTEFDNFRSAQQQRELHQAKEAAYRTLLRQTGVVGSEQRLDAILRLSGEQVDAVELSDGQVKNAAQLSQTIREQWADFIGTAHTQGARTPTPPAYSHASANLGSLSMADYIAKRKQDIH